MKHWLRRLILVVVLLASGSWLASLLLDRSARRAATANGAIRDFHDITADQLDREVRSRLPLGTSRAVAEEYLRLEGMRFSVDPDAREIIAIAPYLKGSNFLVRNSLSFVIHLDESSQVKSIDSKRGLTGL